MLIMATQQTIQWQGMDKFLNLLSTLGKDSVQYFGFALMQEAQAAFLQSQKEVPVKTGVLRASGNIIPPSVVGNQVFVEVVYGGNAKKYAMEQHENESYNHPRGGKAKYLYDPAKARESGFERRLAVLIEAKVRGLV